MPIKEETWCEVRPVENLDEAVRMISEVSPNDTRIGGHFGVPGFDLGRIGEYPLFRSEDLPIRGI